MAYESPFSPYFPTVAISATTSSGSATIANFPSFNNSGTILVSNTGSVWVFVAWGSSAPTASATNGVPIPPNGQRIFSVANVTHVAAITASSTATVYFTPGNGGN